RRGRESHYRRPVLHGELRYRILPRRVRLPGRRVPPALTTRTIELPDPTRVGLPPRGEPSRFTSQSNRCLQQGLVFIRAQCEANFLAGAAHGNVTREDV